MTTTQIKKKKAILLLFQLLSYYNDEIHKILNNQCVRLDVSFETLINIQGRRPEECSSPDSYLVEPKLIKYVIKTSLYARNIITDCEEEIHCSDLHFTSKSASLIEFFSF